MSAYSDLRPVYRDHIRPCDDPHENFNRLRGIWTDPDAIQRKRRQKEFEAEKRKRYLHMMQQTQNY